MTTYVNDLLSERVLIANMIWMDIQGSNNWFSSCSENQNWLAEAISTIGSLYKGCGLISCVGIFTSESQWAAIMCNTSQFSNHALWYANDDHEASFSDFTPFGGWSKPYCKQFKGPTNSCSTAINEDYY